LGLSLSLNGNDDTVMNKQFLDRNDEIRKLRHLIFVSIKGPLKIKDQTDRIAHEDVVTSKYHMKSLIVTLG
jgi:hypothetical protein